MGRLTLILAILLCLNSLNAQSGVKLSSLSHDFGEIDEWGGDVKCLFVVDNNSETPVVITRVRSGCSCVTARYNRKPILPYTQDTLRITFDPRFKAGTLNRVVELYLSNTQEPYQLTLQGYVRGE